MALCKLQKRYFSPWLRNRQPRVPISAMPIISMFLLEIVKKFRNTIVKTRVFWRGRYELETQSSPGTSHLGLAFLRIVFYTNWNNHFQRNLLLMKFREKIYTILNKICPKEIGWFFYIFSVFPTKWFLLLKNSFGTKM